MKRFTIVSYAGAESNLDRVATDDPFCPCLQAKSDADRVLQDTLLDYTVLVPGALTMEPAFDSIKLVDTTRHVLKGANG